MRDGGWAVLYRAVALPSLALGLLLLIPPHAGRRRILLSAALLLVHHAAHLVWLVRPAAAAPALHWLDPLALAGFGLLWGGLFAYGLRHRPNVPATH